MTPLTGIIRRQITTLGPMSVADYMVICLLHPEHGYYTKRDPLGVAGDFTTAPEISQMFGELLGLALAQTWLDQGAAQHFLLVELGPGRASMMADILRATRAVPGFHDALDIWLIEASPALQKVQAEKLRGYNVNWTATVSDLPDAPIFLIANEFFDALPIHQFQKTDNGWRERMIGITNGALTFGLGALIAEEVFAGNSDTRPADLIETCPSGAAIIAEIGRRIAEFGGLALVLDYGGMDPSSPTFQSVSRHQKIDTLAAPGNSDLTAHVNFAALIRATTGVSTSSLTDQGVLLERLGITARARHLAKSLSGDALDTHIAAHRRLTHPDEMGTLFKAIAIYPDGAPIPHGFVDNDT